MSNQELNCKWHFAKQLGGREDGPNDPMQDNFKKTPYASLIRESIQNSLDVVLDSTQPVRMEFSIGRIRSREYPNFFELKNHIKGCIRHFSKNEDAKVTYRPMLEYFDSLSQYDYLYYIKVSDFNTKGMNYIKGDTTQPFYAFVRAAGVSSKNDATAGGSFGYGKAAYFYISPIRSIFVSTQTEHNQRFFEGVSSLCTHEMEDDGDLRVSVGYYDNNDGEPVTKLDNIPTRFQRTEPGTDIYILGIIGIIGVADKIAIYNEMIEAVLRNFWMAIEFNKLEVKFKVDNEFNIDINRNTLPKQMEGFFKDEHDTVRRERNYNPLPYWDAVHYAKNDARHIVIEKMLPILGHVVLYMQKNKKATDKILYMRRPLMLVKAQRTQSSNGFYAVFVCDDRNGNEILRKMENPAHDEWLPSNWRENGKIMTRGKAAFEDLNSFIIQAVESVFSSKSSGIQQIQGLEDFLYIPTAIEEEEDYENESLVGDTQDIKDEEGNSITSDISNFEQTPIEEKPAIGKVMITNPVEERQKEDKEGGHLSGHGTQKKRKRGGGGLSPKRIQGHFVDSEEGLQGTMLTEVPVRYRSFAQMENGHVVHNIVIHSDYEILNGRIDLTIGGEQSDDIVAIKSCSYAGKIEANTISGLHINEGKNVLKITFADNMKHAVKLDAYELK